MTVAGWVNITFSWKCGGCAFHRNKIVYAIILFTWPPKRLCNRQPCVGFFIPELIIMNNMSDQVDIGTNRIREDCHHLQWKMCPYSPLASSVVSIY